jgi:hypothetical protein
MNEKLPFFFCGRTNAKIEPGDLPGKGDLKMRIFEGELFTRSVDSSA